MSDKTHFQRGDKVLYVPPWVSGDTEHSNCEQGILVSFEGDIARVKYVIRETGEYGYPQGTRLSDLRKRK